MFRLRHQYLISIFILAVLFHILYVSHKAPYPFVNIIFLLASPLALLYSATFTFTITVLSWLVFFPVFNILYKIDPLNAALPIFIFNCIQAGFILHDDFLKNIRAERALELEDKEESKCRISEKSVKLSAIEAQIKDKELAMMSLYEITKKMSEDLRFDDIFGAFSVFLKENFTFRKCDLLLLNWDGPAPHIDRIFSVWHKASAADSASSINYDKLIKIFLDKPIEFYISKELDAQSFKSLGIDDKEVLEILGVPLLSEKRIVGILVVQNMSRADLEKFSILSMQFALEIKKILLYEMVEKLAITDSLTGLYVRRYFADRLDEELQRSRRYKLKFALIMADIDNFKRCNDNYGHLVGDVILRDISRVIKEGTREIDIVARYGGEEIALLLPETGRDGALLVAQRLRKKIEESTFRAYDEKLKATVSFGLAVYPEDAEELDDIIEKSDAALYAAKKSGKNIVCEYKKEYNNRL